MRHQNPTIKCSSHTFALLNWVPALGRALYDVVYVQAPVQNLEAELGLIALECGCHIHHCLRYRSHAEIGQSKFLNLPKVDVTVVIRKCVNILGSYMTSIGRGLPLDWLTKQFHYTGNWERLVAGSCTATSTIDVETKIKTYVPAGDRI